MTVSEQMLLCSVFFLAASRIAIFFLNWQIFLSLHGATLKFSKFPPVIFLGAILPDIEGLTSKFKAMFYHQPSAINFNTDSSLRSE